MATSLELFEGVKMLDITLLGCGGMMPLPNRFLTSMMARINGMSILIDCGEGTQITMRKIGLSARPIGVMCITHFHADHISGLPGLLLAMGNSDRTEPLTIIGPKGLGRVVSSLRVIAPELPFEVNCVEIDGAEEVFEFDYFTIEAFRVNHKVMCYGYSIVVNRKGKFDLDAAMKLPIEKKYWGKLQSGETIEVNGVTYTPDMVMGADRKGLRVTYTTDTRPTPAIVEHAKGADLFICEGMYGEEEKRQQAVERKHMMFSEAAEIAASAKPKQMWLTHFSPALIHPDEYIDSARSIFEQTYLGKEGKNIELMFED